MRISDWSSDVCSSDLRIGEFGVAQHRHDRPELLVADQARAAREIADDGRTDEITRPLHTLTTSDDLAEPPGLADERCHVLEPGAVLQRSKLRVRIHAVSEPGGQIGSAHV